MAVGAILVYFAIVFAFIAALFVAEVNRGAITVHFGWLAVAFWLLSLVIK